MCKTAMVFYTLYPEMMLCEIYLPNLKTTKALTKKLFRKN